MPIRRSDTGKGYPKTPIPRASNHDQQPHLILILIHIRIPQVSSFIQRPKRQSCGKLHTAHMYATCGMMSGGCNNLYFKFTHCWDSKFNFIVRCVVIILHNNISGLSSAHSTSSWSSSWLGPFDPHFCFSGHESALRVGYLFICSLEKYIYYTVGIRIILLLES